MSGADRQPGGGVRVSVLGVHMKVSTLLGLTLVQGCVLCLGEIGSPEMSWKDVSECRECTVCPAFRVDRNFRIPKELGIDS